MNLVRFKPNCGVGTHGSPGANGTSWDTEQTEIQVFIVKIHQGLLTNPVFCISCAADGAPRGWMGRNGPGPAATSPPFR